MVRFNIIRGIILGRKSYFLFSFLLKYLENIEIMLIEIYTKIGDNPSPKKEQKLIPVMDLNKQPEKNCAC